MKEEIRRIMTLVKEGKLSPEDAADLIDAFASTPEDAAAEPESSDEAGADGQTPPPPPPGATPPPPPGGTEKDPVKGFVDWVEGVARDVTKNVNWEDVARQVREGAKKGVVGLHVNIENLRKGRVNFPWGSAYETRNISLPITVPKGKTLRIENPNGDVRIWGGHSDGVINATLKMRGTDEHEARENADAFTLLVDESEHEVVLRQHDAPGITLDLEIHLKGHAHLDVKQMNGDLEINNTGGNCRVHNISGDVSLSGLDGTVDVQNANGDVRISDSKVVSLTLEGKSGNILLQRIKGNINARTAHGDITLRECMGKSISVESVSGDVHLDVVEPIRGMVNVRTVNGDTALAIADGSDCRVSLSTLRGDVECDVILSEEARQEQHITGRLGDGTGALDVSAVNGDIRMQLREHMAAAAD